MSYLYKYPVGIQAIHRVSACHGHTYTKIGRNRRSVFIVLSCVFLALFGNSANIPVAHLPGARVITGHIVTYSGMRSIVTRPWYDPCKNLR
jgi:hypothetical protein